MLKDNIMILFLNGTGEMTDSITWLPFAAGGSISDFAMASVVALA